MQGASSPRAITDLISFAHESELSESMLNFIPTALKKELQLFCIEKGNDTAMTLTEIEEHWWHCIDMLGSLVKTILKKRTHRKWFYGIGMMRTDAGAELVWFDTRRHTGLYTILKTSPFFKDMMTLFIAFALCLAKLPLESMFLSGRPRRTFRYSGNRFDYMELPKINTFEDYHRHMSNYSLYGMLMLLGKVPPWKP